MDAALSNTRIDLLLLGMEPDGTVGFNIPSDAFETLPHAVKLSEEGSDAPVQAFTLGMRDIVRAKKVILFAFGAGSADAVQRLFAYTRVDPRLPCSMLRLCACAVVCVDAALAAAAGLRD